MADNVLYYGDNLDILRRYIDDESVDLIYLDPPFNKKATYNVLFAEKNGSDSAAQIKAFEDTWHWDEASAEAFFEVVEAGGPVADAMRAFRILLGHNDMLAYLAMMAPRLVELHRVLKPTGSIYLHCDPTASHYLKVLMDAIFGPANYRNEIVWNRTPFKGSSKARARQLPKSHDIVLFYSSSERWTWNPPTQPYSEKYRKRFKWKDDRGYYRKTLLKTYSKETFERLKREDRLIEPAKPGAMYSYKQYLAESSGRRRIDDSWTDINMINPVAKERLGYPTQKPEALLQRIIEATSNEGDMVLDPFCGCGTTLIAAQRLKRRWVGIDITHLAVTLMKHRLQDTFGEEVSYEVIGEPTTLPDAKVLAEQDRFQFEVWALGLLGARPTSQKRGADKGIDGRLYFHDEPKGKTKQIIMSVKSGHILPSYVRDLRGVVEREKAQIGVLITLGEPTRAMKSEAASAGFYDSPWGTKHPIIQILTVEELLNGKKIDYPPTRGDATFRKAPRAGGEKPSTVPLFRED